MAQKSSYEPSKSDIAQIIESVMERAQESGIEITVQNVVAKDGRPDGLLVFFGGIKYDSEKGVHYPQEDSIRSREMV